MVGLARASRRCAAQSPVPCLQMLAVQAGIQSLPMIRARKVFVR